METIKVNMTPCDDVETIHASQNDNEAREWGFELHNNGEKIDSSSISDQLVFKAYEGGTEELLPSGLLNGSVDLGRLTWTYESGQTYPFFRSADLVDSIKAPSSNSQRANVYCAKYVTTDANKPYLGQITNCVAVVANGQLYIYDTSFTDAVAFKQAMQGVYLWFEKSDSTPTTTPINADIKYPQGLLTEQEFTYRESPTEEDGLANIVDIKGQTIKWNQQSKLAQNWTMNYGGATVTRGDDEITVSNVLANYYAYQGTGMKPQNGHVILVTCYAKANNGECGLYTNFGNVVFPKTSSSTYQLLSVINKETRSSATNYDYNIQLRVSMDSDSVSFKNPQIFDLTLMFGSTKAEEIFQMEQTTTGNGLAYFKQFFPLDFYPYDSGSLIPFMGNGIKTVGKNQIKLSADNLVSSQRIEVSYSDSGAVFTANGTYSRAGYTCKTIKGQQYTLSFKGSSNGNFRAIYISNDLDWNARYGRINLSETETNNSLTFTATDELFFIGFYLTNTGTSGSMTIKDIQLELGSSVTSYVPYTSSLAELPISTYFPNGMKQAGNVYDELLPNKATTRIGKVTVDGTNTGIGATALTNVMRITVPIDTAKYNSNQISNNLPFLVSYTSDTEHFYVSDTYIQMFIDKTKCGTTFNSVKQYLSSNPTIIYYELATPTETSFTTASLVTENGEVALANENGVLVGKCNSDVSADAGFIEGKIKLSDEDGDVYSNKIQIHVERKPS